MLIAVGSLTVMGVALGGMLGAAARFLAVEENPLEEELKAMLPGSQCGQCGYVGCGQAAAALARGEAPVTLCPPGGRAVAEALAKKLGVTADLSEHEEKVPEYAVVREELCIGCTLLHQGMLGGRDHRRQQADALGDRRSLPRLRQVRQGLPHRRDRNAPGAGNAGHLALGQSPKPNTCCTRRSS